MFLQIQEPQWIPNRIDLKSSTLTHIIIKPLETKDRENLEHQKKCNLSKIKMISGLFRGYFEDWKAVGRQKKKKKKEKPTTENSISHKTVLQKLDRN